MRAYIEAFTTNFENKGQLTEYYNFFGNPRFKLTLRLVTLKTVTDPSVTAVVTKIRSDKDFKAKS